MNVNYFCVLSSIYKRVYNVIVSLLFIYLEIAVELSLLQCREIMKNFQFRSIQNFGSELSTINFHHDLSTQKSPQPFGSSDTTDSKKFHFQQFQTTHTKKLFNNRNNNNNPNTKNSHSTNPPADSAAAKRAGRFFFSKFF